MRETLSCANLFDGETFRGPSRLIIEDGTVAALEKSDGPCDFPIVAPGYVDIQMNGFAAHDVATLDEISGPLLDEELASLGTTSWLGTVVTAPLDSLSRSLHRIDDLISKGAVPGCAGIHLEGPFLGGAPGAHNPSWITPFDLDWLASLPESLRLITVAAEQSRISEAIGRLLERHTVVSLGHSRPTKDQFDEAVNTGASLVTHVFNGMSGVHHREGGLALWALTEDRVRAGLIADMTHVSAEAVSLAFRSKGGGGICLVSDSVAWDTERARSREIVLTDGAPRLPDGTIAGSSTPLAQCVRNVVQLCGVDTASALRAATSSPARAAGLPDRGHIAVGSRADVIALDDDLHVLGTWRRLPFGRDQQIDP